MLWIAFLGSFLSSEMKSPQDLIVMKRLVALIIDVILALVILGTTAARYKYKKHRSQRLGMPLSLQNIREHSLRQTLAIRENLKGIYSQEVRICVLPKKNSPKIEKIEIDGEE